ncbi:MAG: class I SAM-dependent rRNA methyltransferase [Eubacteriales bacterium]|nr:class I SAM-dependent rRNA methyltransferase [Eubacteriales bacterium]
MPPESKANLTTDTKATLTLKNGVHRAAAQGHPWVYRTQIETVTGDPLPGDVVTVLDFRGRYLGTGFYNPHSMITVRILTQSHETIAASLIATRIRSAITFRRQFWRPDTDSYRLVFGEADRLPGLIVDLFARTLVVQILSLGMEQFLDPICETLLAEIKPERLILQHEEAIRSKEGLPLYRRIFAGADQAQETILENGLKLTIDLASGQKTGYFLDQKANHAYLRPFVQGKKVLDCFTYIGGFALNALAGDASDVTAVDVSDAAMELTRANARQNGFSDRLTPVVANAFDFLREQARAKVRYDVIVLDPPAFAKSHSAQAGAARGYKEINLSALKMLESGGVLATHSCSFHMPEDLFLETVLSAARDARRTVRILDVRRQDFDHPVLGGYPESHYLKSVWLQVI